MATPGKKMLFDAQCGHGSVISNDELEENVRLVEGYFLEPEEMVTVFRRSFSAAASYIKELIEKYPDKDPKYICEVAFINYLREGKPEILD